MNSKTSHNCEFCQKEFSRESAIIKHRCEKKKRWLAKEEKSSILAYYCFTRFHELNRTSKKYSFFDFINSKLYKDFIKFGTHLHENQIINQSEFIDFLLKSGMPIKDWTKKQTYEKFIGDILKKESPQVALERSINLMIKWSDESGKDWNKFFENIPPLVAIRWIQTGKLSPWILFNCDSGINLLNSFSEEQLKIIEAHINSKFWKIHFLRNKTEVKFIKQTLKEAGL